MLIGKIKNTLCSESETVFRSKPNMGITGAGFPRLVIMDLCGGCRSDDHNITLEGIRIFFVLP